MSKTKEELGNDNMTCIIVKFKSKFTDEFLKKHKSPKKTHKQNPSSTPQPPKLTLEEMATVLQQQQFLQSVLPSEEDFEQVELAQQAQQLHPAVRRWLTQMQNYNEADKK